MHWPAFQCQHPPYGYCRQWWTCHGGWSEEHKCYVNVSTLGHLGYNRQTMAYLPRLQHCLIKTDKYSNSKLTKKLTTKKQTKTKRKQEDKKNDKKTIKRQKTKQYQTNKPAIKSDNKQTNGKQTENKQRSSKQTNSKK